MMRLHFGSRRVASGALGIFLLVLSGTATVAGAAPTADGRGRESAPGQVNKAEPATTPADGTPTAADNPEGDSTHDAANGPGGQVCDGDPSGKSDGGGGANGGGENYDNTCPDGPSQNGAGDGEATGKPCAGCVGNADDKNPPGQDPSGPVDANNGYECDQKGRSADEGNNGVGFGNPAHTGCTGTVTPPTCPDGSAMPAGGAKDCGAVDVETCPDGSAMPAGGAKDCGAVDAETCPDGSAMPASGDTAGCGQGPCVATPTATCGVPTAVLGVTVERPTEVLGVTVERPTEVLGVTVERPTEVLGVQLSAEQPKGGVLAAAAGLARTGAELHVLVQLALLLALVGLGLTLSTRRRLDTGAIDISERLRSY